jgi:TonB family protein
MGWTTLAGAAAIGLVATVAVAASSLPPLGLNEVSFHRRPKADGGFQFYPREALAARIEGHATALCTVEASGELAACAIAEETPPGYGFGAKVLETAHFIRIYSLSRYGAPTKGRLILVPIKFTLPPRT